MRTVVEEGGLEGARRLLLLLDRPLLMLTASSEESSELLMLEGEGGLTGETVTVNVASEASSAYLKAAFCRVGFCRADVRRDLADFVFKGDDDDVRGVEVEEEDEEDWREACREEEDEVHHEDEEPWAIMASESMGGSFGWVGTWPCSTGGQKGLRKAAASVGTGDFLQRVRSLQPGEAGGQSVGWASVVCQ